MSFWLDCSAFLPYLEYLANLPGLLSLLQYNVIKVNILILSSNGLTDWLFSLSHSLSLSGCARMDGSTTTNHPAANLFRSSHVCRSSSSIKSIIIFYRYFAKGFRQDRQQLLEWKLSLLLLLLPPSSCRWGFLTFWSSDKEEMKRKRMVWRRKRKYPPVLLISSEEIDAFKWET